MDDNKLIAEFMGLPKEKIGLGIRQETIYGISHDDWYTYDNLNYHISWDWLMPVVEKCFVIHNKLDKADDLIFKLNDALLTTNIDSLYKVVVEFIKWYNEQGIKMGEKKKKICGYCGEIIDRYPALSRQDNETKICSSCGQEEAMADYLAEILRDMYGGIVRESTWERIRELVRIYKFLEIKKGE